MPEASFNDVKMGFEFECISPWGYDAFGVRIRRDLGFNVDERGRNYVNWSVVGDGSVNPTAGRGGHALELVSPVMSLVDGMRELARVLEWGQLNGVYTNSSCGLHIGVSVDGHMRNFDKLTLLLSMDHDMIHRKWGRVNNTYAQNLMKGLKSAVKQQAITWETHWPANTTMADKIRGLIPVSKYTGANLSKLQNNVPYVEFRAMGGCIDQRVPEVLDTVAQYARVMLDAVNPNWLNTPTGRRKFDVFNEDMSNLVAAERVRQRAEVERQEREERERRELATRAMNHILAQRGIALESVRAGQPVPDAVLPEGVARPAARPARRRREPAPVEAVEAVNNIGNWGAIIRDRMLGAAEEPAVDAALPRAEAPQGHALPPPIVGQYIAPRPDDVVIRLADNVEAVITPGRDMVLNLMADPDQGPDQNAEATRRARELARIFTAEFRRFSADEVEGDEPELIEGLQAAAAQGLMTLTCARALSSAMNLYNGLD